MFEEIANEIIKATMMGATNSQQILICFIRATRFPFNFFSAQSPSRAFDTKERSLTRSSKIGFSRSAYWVQPISTSCVQRCVEPCVYCGEAVSDERCRTLVLW